MPANELSQGIRGRNDIEPTRKVDLSEKRSTDWFLHRALQFRKLLNVTLCNMI